MYRFVGSATVVLLVATVALSDEFVARITKSEDGKITFTKGFGGKNKKNADAAKPEPMTLPLDEKCKFVKGKFNKKQKTFASEGDLDGGRATLEKQIVDSKGKKGKKKGGLTVQIVTEGEGDKAKVSEIRVFAAKKKKKKDADKKEHDKKDADKKDADKKDADKKDADKKETKVGMVSRPVTYNDQPLSGGIAVIASSSPRGAFRAVLRRDS